MQNLAAALCQRFERWEITIYQRFFLRPAPVFDLTLSGDRVGDAIEFLVKDQRDWSQAGGVAAERPRIMLGDALLERRARCSRVVGTVRATKNVEISAHGSLQSHPASLDFARDEGYR